jgi:hypothetical protein
MQHKHSTHSQTWLKIDLADAPWRRVAPVDSSSDRPHFSESNLVVDFSKYVGISGIAVRFQRTLAVVSVEFVTTCPFSLS